LEFDVLILMVMYSGIAVNRIWKWENAIRIITGF
jgi:hypothetical protein